MPDAFFICHKEKSTVIYISKKGGDFVDKARSEIYPFLIEPIKNAVKDADFSHLQEIRIRTGRPVMLLYGKERKIPGEVFLPTSDDIEKQIQIFCKSSRYAYQEEMKNGFLTLTGGHRVGLGGRAVIKNEEVIAMTDFSSINIRIAREYPNCSLPLLDKITEGNRIYSTVLISPPGVGKTTFLRDIGRMLSRNFRVCIVDERSEIAAMKNGAPQFDVGLQTDVLDAFPKEIGMRNALRALSPDVLITDEIGDEKDKKAIGEVLKGGCKIITSMHGYSIEEAQEKKGELMEFFECAVLLQKTEDGVEVAACKK